jgi:hypothetical protein
VLVAGDREFATQTLDEYRQAAEAAKRLAEQTTDEGERQALLRIAAEWDSLVEYREQKKRQLS